MANQLSVRVWDLPLRIFHWVLVLLIAGLIATGLVGGFDIQFSLGGGKIFFLKNIELHMLLGQAVLGLVLFRVMWGVVGSSTARFASFVRGRRAVLDYLNNLRRGNFPASVGHNPAGALMVLALLAVIFLQVSTGLFAHDDEQVKAPLAHLVSAATSDALSEAHGLIFLLLMACVITHIAAIFYYFVRGKNLIAPMISGDKPVSLLPEKTSAPVIAPLWRAALCVLLALAVVCILRAL